MIVTCDIVVSNKGVLPNDCGRALEQVDTRKYAEGLYGYTQVLLLRHRLLPERSPGQKGLRHDNTLGIHLRTGAGMGN